MTYIKTKSTWDTTPTYQYFFSSHYTTPAQCWVHDLAPVFNSSRSSWVGSTVLWHGGTGRVLHYRPMFIQTFEWGHPRCIGPTQLLTKSSRIIFYALELGMVDSKWKTYYYIIYMLTFKVIICLIPSFGQRLFWLDPTAFGQTFIVAELFSTLCKL